MPALTLWPEWAHAVARLGKDVENRTWAPSPRRLPVGRWIAIHAGKHVGGAPSALEEGIAAVFKPLRLPVLRRVKRGQAAQIWVDGQLVVTSGVIAVARFGGCVSDSPSSWAVPGLVHWKLDQVIALAEPVPCAGRQGLWKLPREIDAAVRAQVAVSHG
jgi:hypothetical protein